MTLPRDKINPSLLLCYIQSNIRDEIWVLPPLSKNLVPVGAEFVRIKGLLVPFMYRPRGFVDLL